MGQPRAGRPADVGRRRKAEPAHETGAEVRFDWYDAHAEDHLADLRLHEADYGRMARRIAEVIGPGRLLFFLEGGYDLEAITGSVLVSSTSQNVFSSTCEMSTIMPRSFIFLTTWRPNSVSHFLSGPTSGSERAATAQSVEIAQVRVMYRTPRS